jgi:hypothetical protein
MLHKKLYLFLFIFCFLPLALHSQTKNKDQLKEYFDDAEYFFDDGDYREALFNFMKIHEKDSANANINYRIGMCYINISGEEYKAIPYFEAALPKISTKYEKSTFEERKAPLYALFYLGNAYRIDNQIKKALDVYKKFRSNPSFEDNYNAAMVDNEIAACERAKIIQDNPINATFVNLGSVINNMQSNRNPLVNSDETMIIYLSSLKFYDAIFMSKKINGTWGEPVNISSDVGSDGDCEPVCLSADGTELYLVRKIRKTTDLYVSKLKDSIWGPMEALNKNINTSSNENHASVSKDGKTLYFSSDRRGGVGKLDIYKSDRQPNGEWGPAVNLGENVNTEEDETNPFICEDNKTIYFSSKGHLNMGGFDIFSTRRMANGRYEKPVNAGYPINTTGDNLFYFPLRNGEIAYSALIRKEGLGKEDIYRIENLTLQSRNKHASNDKTLKIVVRDKLTNDILGILYYDQKADSLKIKQASEKVDIHLAEQ